MKSNGMVRTTIADVARAAGVSPTTVSHALSGSGRVGRSTRERVRAAAEELGYRPSPRATALRRGRSATLAMVSSMDAAVAGGDAHQGFYLELAAAAARRAFDLGYALVLLPPVRGDELDALERLAVDGVIVVEPSADDPVVALLRADRQAFVSIGAFPGSQPDDVVVDLRSQDIASLLIGHLVDLGVRAPALVLGDRDRTSFRAAERAYLEAAAGQGWEPITVRVPESAGVDGGRRATEQLLAERRIDAVAAWVDAFAVGALEAVRSAGAPGVRIVTRYDGPRARASTPGLTAVQMHLPEVAEAAVDLLLEQLGEDLSSARSIPPPELVVRASSASPS